jgi:8-oxo-dGTP diphosphatase
MARSSKETKRGPLIRAAGGVLWRADGGSPALAVVHRPKHRDWSLPKGKLEPGESFAEAALREVAEETGCRAELGDFAGYALYEVKGREKLALFWNMSLIDDLGFTPTGEIDDVAWLVPAAALGRLSHQLERGILRGVLAARAIEARHGWARPRSTAGRLLAL